MFERMEITESIYEGVVETFYKKSTREDDNHTGLRSKMKGEYDFVNYFLRDEWERWKAKKKVCRPSKG